MYVYSGDRTTSLGLPIILLYDAKAGHAGGQPYNKIVEDSTAELRFVAWQLGVK
jgi:hypothetical protein